MNLFDYYADIIPDKETWDDIVKQPLSASLWTNTLKISPEKLRELMREDGCELLPLSWHSSAFKAQTPKLGKCWEYVTGLFQIQEEVSMLPVKLLNPVPGERVLDLCAAPGNKTAQIAVLMKNTGTVLANDRNYNRMKALGQISKRLGLMNISTSIYDGRNYPQILNYFDKVLVDAPCSGEGTFRKHPGRVAAPNIKNSRRLHHIQIALLKKAIALCKPGGRIVYSTCTFAPEENEAVIDAILKSQGDSIRVLPINLPLFRFSPGITAWKDACYHPDVKNTARVWPHLNNTGGFYLAMLERTDIPDNVILDLIRDPEIKNTNQKKHHYLSIISDRFGISDNILQQYHFTDNSYRGIYMVNEDNQVPANIKLDATGLFFMKTKIRFPKLSTAAAMIFGQHATKNSVTISSAQRDQYLQKKDFPITPEQEKHCTGTGYVILNYENFSIGVGLYFSSQSGRPAMLRSLFPKYLRLE